MQQETSHRITGLTALWPNLKTQQQHGGTIKTRHVFVSSETTGLQITAICQIILYLKTDIVQHDTDYSLFVL